MLLLLLLLLLHAPLCSRLLGMAPTEQVRRRGGLPRALWIQKTCWGATRVKMVAVRGGALALRWGVGVRWSGEDGARGGTFPHGEANWRMLTGERS